ncbi:MAG: M20/M25/M40 family metallo-hydrolase [Planctomycetota bacterium]|jgi:acetylornithine deacetylase/succinyl-diaminopimelate desuccinylase-like protein
MTRLRMIALIVALATAFPVSADPGDLAGFDRVAIEDWLAAHRGQILDELTGFLELPNIAANRDDMRRNADHLQQLLAKRGLEVRMLDVGGVPYVTARLMPQAPHPHGKPPTVLFYCHFDGQPVDPSRWTVNRPFEPKLMGEIDDPEARLYARSASDDKAPIVGLLSAIDALRAAGNPPSIDAKFIFDPEEEVGSPHLATLVEQHGGLLEADLLIFADGPVHQSGRPTVVFGSRGLVAVTLTTYGAASALHSGHYGNWAPNPAEKLARLLASMKGADGRVRIEGFYDDVEELSEHERRALESIPAVESELQHDLLIPRPDGGGKTLQQLINLPSLNVRGLASGWVGTQVRTIVPATATAELDLRLVRGVAPERQVERIKAHARKQGFFVVEEEPTEAIRREHADVVWIRTGHATPAARTPMDTPVSRALISAVSRAVAVEPVLMPTLGGTGPLSQFERELGMPVYGVPIVNADNNQHAPDENLRLGNLWEGIVIYASLLHLPDISAR